MKSGVVKDVSRFSLGSALSLSIFCLAGSSEMRVVYSTRWRHEMTLRCFFSLEFCRDNVIFFSTDCCVRVVPNSVADAFHASYFLYKPSRCFYPMASVVTELVSLAPVFLLMGSTPLIESVDVEHFCTWDGKSAANDLTVN